MWNSVAVEVQFTAAAHRALLVQMAVAEVMGVELGRIGDHIRGDPKSALARQVAMYLCRMAFEMNLSQIGQAFGRDRHTVRHALQRVEDLREDREFDRAIAWLESSLRRIGGRP